LKKIASMLLTALALFVSAAHAQTYGGQAAAEQFRVNRHARRAACEFKSVGTTCTFTQGGQRVGGTCQPAAQGHLACYNVVGRPGFYQHGPAAGGMSAGDLPEQ